MPKLTFHKFVDKFEGCTSMDRQDAGIVASVELDVKGILEERKGGSPQP